MAEQKQRLWTPRASVRLSQGISYLCAAGLAALAAGFPWVLEWLRIIPAVYLREAALRPYVPRFVWAFVAVFYLCCPAGFAALGALLRLLHHIQRGAVFTQQNVRLLRVLSWCCTWAAAVSACGARWYFPLWLVVAAAGFLAVILRVVKNVIAQAVALREENDLTI